jgi:hypothetical protein
MKKILYAGDSSLSGAASYLAGVLTHYGLPFDYVPSGKALSSRLARGRYGLFILSDYPASRLRPADCRTILDSVRAGAGLLMIGGWESYHGLGGDWDRSPLAEALPVRISAGDDRVNSSQPVVVQKVLDHPIVAGLPFGSPPHVGGYNRVRAKPGGRTILMGRHMVVRAGRGGGGASRVGGRPRGAGPGPSGAGVLRASPGRSSPMLVVGAYGLGRSAAFASDAAPHWVGGLVDWGAARVAARAHGGEGVEVGAYYAQFLAQLVRWTMGELP